MRSLNELVRSNILSLEPYSSARDEACGYTNGVFLDANENPYNAPFNRYPDPLQKELKVLLAKVKNVKEEQIFLGNGSDEAIDIVYRCFVEPRKDNVVAIEPTYGMYKVCADINAVEYRKVPLGEGFCLDSTQILSTCDTSTKVIWLCSPNNPTANSLEENEIEKILRDFDGIVVLDEAYGDFSKHQSFRTQLNKYNNLIVLNTMSKAWGCAAIRLGMAFASPSIIQLFNKVKYPYNINSLTIRHAIEALSKPQDVDRWVQILLEERDKMCIALSQLKICEKVFPTDANFILARFINAQRVYNSLLDAKVIVRNRSRVAYCNECLRITVGTKTENTSLLAVLKTL